LALALARPPALTLRLRLRQALLVLQPLLVRQLLPVAAVGLNAVVALSVLGPFLRERLHTPAYAVRAIAAAMAVGYEAVIDVAAGELVLPEFAHGVSFFFLLLFLAGY
jgi:hypothetical protein